MNKLGYINVYGAMIGNNLDNTIKMLSDKGIDFKEISNANKRIRQLFIGEKQASFRGILYNSIRLDFLDNILYCIVLSEITDLEKGISKYVEENKKLSSVFGTSRLEKETEILKECFYTDTFISCTAQYGTIIGLDKITKGYLHIRYFDNISELSIDRTHSNPAIVSIIRENLYLYKKINSSRSSGSVATKQKLVSPILALKFIIVLILGILIFLFVLNDRYQHIGNGLVLDKWTQTIKKAEIK